MTPLDYPLGPLDVATADASLPDPRRSSAGLRLREAHGLVSMGGDYLVPDAPLRGHEPSDGAAVCAAAWYLRQGYGPDADAAQPLLRLGLVTEDDIRLVDPSGAQPNKTPWAYSPSTTARRAQLAALGQTLFVASEYRDDGAGPRVAGTRPTVDPERVVVVEGDGGVGLDLADGRPWIPSVEAITTAQVGRTATKSEGLTYGLYAVRLAAVRRDGSLGPASRPTVFELTPPSTIGACDYATAGASTTGMDTLTITGTAATDDFLAIVDDFGGTVPGYLIDTSTVRYPVAVIAAQHDGANTTLTLAEKVPYGVLVGDGFELGDRARVTISTASAFTVPGMTATQRDRYYRGVEVLLTAPLPSTPIREERFASACEAPYYRVGDLGLAAAGSVRTTDLTTARVLGLRAFEEGAVSAGVRACRAATFGGRLLLGSVALDYPEPAEGLLHRAYVPSSGGVVSALRFLYAVTLETASGQLTRWSSVFELAVGELIEELYYYPDAQATRLDIYYEPVYNSGDFELDVSLPMETSLVQNAAYTTGEALAVGGGAAPPVLSARNTANAKAEWNAGRVHVSGAGRPFEVRPERLLDAGGGPADAVQGIATVGESVSQGQFGEYPALILCRDSVWGLRLNDSGEPLGTASVTKKLGCVGPEAWVVVDRAVVWVSEDGVYSFGLGLEPRTNLAAALFTSTEGRAPASTAYSMAPDDSVVASVYRDGHRRELWVTSPTVDGTGVSVGRMTWVLDLRSLSGEPRWTTLARARTGAVRLDDGVEEHGWSTTFDADGIWKESGGATPERWRITTAAVSIADGYVRRVQRAAVSGDLSTRLALSLGERVDNAAAGRAEREVVPVRTLLIEPEVAHETDGPCRMARVVATVEPEDGAVAVAGDRIRSIHITTQGPVRRRRRRGIPSS